MINGWNIKTNWKDKANELVESHIFEVSAEPVFAEIGEKVRELTSELHMKILNQELIWSLQLTPISMVKQLRDMCDNEIKRREEELEDLRKEI